MTRPILRALRSRATQTQQTPAPIPPSPPSPDLPSTTTPQLPTGTDSTIFPGAENTDAVLGLNARGDHPRNSISGITATPVQATKEWHESISPDLRNHLAHKLLESICPSPHRLAMLNHRICSLVAYAKRVECEIYEVADSRSEYCHLIVTKIYNVQKVLEEKRQNRIRIEQRDQQRRPCLATTQPQTAIRSPIGPMLTQSPININFILRPPQPPLNGPLGNNFQPQVPLSSPPPILANNNTAMTQSQTSQGKNFQSDCHNSNQPQFSLPFPQTPKSVPSFVRNMVTRASSVKCEPPPTPSTSASTLPASNLDKPKKCLFKSGELKAQLLPVLDKLWQQYPESDPFIHPIDPTALGIPDYFDKIKEPMDLRKIWTKLKTDTYTDPWQLVDDVWLMFDNAWLYNHKTSVVYGYCSKLSEVFGKEIDPVMKTLGFCCGRKYAFNPQTLFCYGKQICTIPRDAKYYSYKDSITYAYCQKCFKNIKGDTVTIEYEDPSQPSVSIKKMKFVELKNDHLELEPFINCNNCGRKVHQICVLHLDCIWPQGFTCANCLKAKQMKKKSNEFNAKRLPATKLGAYLERRVNNFLKNEETGAGAGAGKVFIPVLSSSDKIVEVKSGMKQRFVDHGDMEGTFPYRTKAIFAFQVVDGTEVCFFGMYVQEYGSDCPAPNTRRVYIAYMDSVRLFEPGSLRTKVYHEILLGYLKYVKRLGYTMAHIWACPPLQGDDYIFYSHPHEQKIPKAKRLLEWYKKMLDKGIAERTVVEYKDIHKQAMEDKFNSAVQLPYFEGDFWPNILENSIKELDQKEQKMRKVEKASAASASESDEVEVSLDGQKKRKKSNKAEGNTSKKTGKDLYTKLLSIMKKHTEAFIVIRLHSTKSSGRLGPIQDPDSVETCDLMDTRNGFLTFAREKYYEFSCLRRAKFSTMAMLYEIHNQGQDVFVYTCDYCKSRVETRHHCSVCDDFDLCVGCYGKQGHPHKMERLGFELDDDSSPVHPDAKQLTPYEARKLKIQWCIKYLVHSCHCRDDNCNLPSCPTVKRAVAHAKVCKRKTNGDCLACKQLIALFCYHGKHCIEANCRVPLCSSIKHTSYNIKLAKEFNKRST